MIKDVKKKCIILTYIVLPYFVPAVYEDLTNHQVLENLKKQGITVDLSKLEIKVCNYSERYFNFLISQGRRTRWGLECFWGAMHTVLQIQSTLCIVQMNMKLRFLITIIMTTFFFFRKANSISQNIQVLNNINIISEY